jgi:hypothetical protein
MADRWLQKDREHERLVREFFNQCVKEGRATPEELADIRRHPELAGTKAMRRVRND